MIRASRNYRPGIFHGNLYCLRGSDDDWKDSQVFWGPMVDGDIVKLTVPGRDAEAFDKQNVRILAEKLQACLNAVEENRS